MAPLSSKYTQSKHIITRVVCRVSFTNFTIRDKDTPVFKDIMVGLADGEFIALIIDGGEPEMHEDSSMSKQSLAAKPYELTLEDSQKMLEIGFNLSMDRLTVKYQGVDIDKLKAIASKSIHQNKIVSDFTDQVK